MKVILKARAPQKEIHFESANLHLTLGRGDKAHIKIPDENMSRVHSKIYVENNKLWIEDMASKNGTFVNGVRVQKSQLFLQDKVLIGDTEITIPSAKNTPQVVKLLEFQGNTEDRQRKGLEVDENNEALTQVRLNPLSAIKAPSSLKTKQSRRQLSGNAMFKDSMHADIEDELDDPRLNQKWRHTAANLIDNLAVIIAMALPAVIFWTLGFTGKSKNGVAGVFEVKQLAVVAGSALVAGLVFWVLNTKNSGGSLGERLTGIAAAMKASNK